jgi:hypothetical protein
VREDRESEEVGLVKEKRQEREGQKIDEKDSDEQEFYDVEMQPDGEMFTGKNSEIVPGKFVSFRYTGRFHNGPPINPRISLYNKNILCFFLSFIYVV